MGLIFVLHVIGIGILLKAGQYFTSHRQAFTPEMQLEDDYYRNPKKASVSPFAAPNLSPRPKEDEEAILEQERLMRQRRKQEQLQPSTNP
ncbi:MAG: hypothetical protein EOP07_23495 [Proteobacteria bacterium]|nr:MAG: hypothetical protein EOP07_23495 [Pseudomonadota bacterium]